MAILWELLHWAWSFVAVTLIVGGVAGEIPGVLHAGLIVSGAQWLVLTARVVGGSRRSWPPLPAPCRGTGG